MAKLLHIWCAAGFALTSGAAQAAWPHYPGCFDAAAARYGISSTLLRAIAKVESNYQTDAIHHNTNGTRDVCVMQINSSHFDRLRPLGISEDTLLNRPCTCISVGASILAGFVAQFGMTWRAVGSYNAGTHPSKEAARIAYAARVQRAFDHIATGDRKARSAQLDTSQPSTPLGAVGASRLQVLE